MTWHFGTARAYFNPHSPCGERLSSQDGLYAVHAISIHTPLAGSDAPFSTICATESVFQSTLPLRGATRVFTVNPHREAISIHTPLAGSDQNVRRKTIRHQNFNPHSPCGERLGDVQRIVLRTRISIHTPLAGSDSFLIISLHTSRHFNPHSPCGERPNFSWAEWTPNTFQSTLPLRGATTDLCRMFNAVCISIHTPLAGSDSPSEVMMTIVLLISIHTPLAGSDLKAEALNVFPQIFQSTLPLRGATTGVPALCTGRGYFNPHSPCGERLVRLCLST